MSTLRITKIFMCYVDNNTAKPYMQQ